MGGGSKSGGSTTTVQKADPWSGVQPYLTSAYEQANKLYGGAGPQYYPYQQLATPNYWEGQGQDLQLSNLNSMMQLGGLGQYGANRLVGAGSAAADQGAAGAFNAMNNLGYAGAELGRLGGSAANTGIHEMNRLSDFMTGAGSSGLSGAMNALGETIRSGMPQEAGSNAFAGANLLQGAGDVMNNPYLASAMQAAIRPVQQQFTEQVMPGIKQGAMGAGQMGGSRQGIAEGIASRGYMDTVGDITARMGSEAYGQGLGAVEAGANINQQLFGQGLGAVNQLGQLSGGLLGQAGGLRQAILGAGVDLSGLGLTGQSAAGQLGSGMFGTGMENLGRGTALAPTAQQGLLAAGQTAEQIGQQRTADQQAQIDAAMQQWNYNQQLPYNMISDYLQLLQGAPGGVTSSSMSGGGGNRLMSGLGGAATGYGLGGALATGMGLAGPWGMGGALLGGALGLWG